MFDTQGRCIALVYRLGTELGELTMTSNPCSDEHVIGVSAKCDKGARLKEQDRRFSHCDLIRSCHTRSRSR